MNWLERATTRWAPIQERLAQSYRVAWLERAEEYINSLSIGDRVIAYTLAALVCTTSLAGLYALQQSLLVTVPTYGGSLVEGDVGSPRFINPLLALSDADRDLTVLTYSGLMGLTGTGELAPVVASGYEISPDGKTYTFHIREDARFSDGTPLTASDVVFTIQKAQNSNIKSPEFANWAGVSVSATDDQTVQFILAKPYAPFIQLTTLGILPERLWQGISDSDFSFSDLQVNPVGSGPFKVQSVVKGSGGLIERIVLVQNKYYPLGRPYLDRITFRFYPRNEDLVTALQNGTVESAYDVPMSDAISAPYARVFGVFWNQNENQVYARAEVREALSIALDRENIVETVLGGAATPIIGPVPPNSGIISAKVPAHDNPTEAAAEVLRDSGWKYDGEERVWTNAKAEQTLTTITIRTSNVPELKSVAGAVKADWEKLGVPVSVELYEPGDLSQNIIRPRKYSSLLYGMVIGRTQDLYPFWSSQERNDPGLNIALYTNKSVDALLDDARSNTDASIRLDDLQKIEDTIASEYPAAFIYAPDFTYRVPGDLGGVELPQIVTPADRFASVASWHKETDRVWPFFVRSK